jgi:hypothetical protein
LRNRISTFTRVPYLCIFVRRLIQSIFCIIGGKQEWTRSRTFTCKERMYLLAFLLWRLFWNATVEIAPQNFRMVSLHGETHPSIRLNGKYRYESRIYLHEHCLQHVWSIITLTCKGRLNPKFVFGLLNLRIICNGLVACVPLISWHFVATAMATFNVLLLGWERLLRNGIRWDTSDASSFLMLIISKVSGVSDVTNNSRELAKGFLGERTTKSDELQLDHC